MAFPPTDRTTPLLNDIIQVRAAYTIGNQTAFNVRTFRVSAVTGIGQTLQQIADNRDAAYGPLVRPVITAAWRYQGIGARIVAPQVSFEFASVVNAGLGQLAGDTLPPGTSQVVRLRTAFPGKSGRGRMFFPPPSEAENSATGLPTAAYQVTLGLVVAPLTQQFTVGGAGNTVTLIPVIWKRNTLTVKDITSVFMELKWSHVHRRGAYGAPNPPPF